MALDAFETILKEARIIVADTEAKNVDTLTLGSAMRLTTAIKDIIANDDVLNGGKTRWARGE
jgi:hypothetical protein